MLQKASRNPALAPQLDWPRRLNIALDAAKVFKYFVPCMTVCFIVCSSRLTNCAPKLTYDLLGAGPWVGPVFLPVLVVWATETYSACVILSKQT